MTTMVSAQYVENGLGYNFIMSDSSSGMTQPDAARYSDIEEIRIQDGVTIQAWIGPTDLENWIEEMARSDNTLLPRYAEDILDGMADKSGVPQITLDRLQAKKDKRGERP